MALDKASLQTALEAAFGADQVSDPASKANIQAMAAQVADAVDTFVKSGTVTSNGATQSGPPGGPLPIAGLTGTIS